MRKKSGGLHTVGSDNGAPINVWHRRFRHKSTARSVKSLAGNMKPIKSDAHHPFAAWHKTDSVLCYEEFHKIRFTAGPAPTSGKTARF